MGRRVLYETGFVAPVRFLDGQLLSVKFNMTSERQRPILTLTASACYHGSAGFLQ
ncbi:MAG TPA: hypothetical protein VK709_05610 [Candidatus Saccharimonadales bacterium]|nr:hypothetical protein [Candidatus Saccharimonadales bacterium]